MSTKSREDFQRAASWYEKSAGMGNVQASVNLGHIWYYGRTGRKDYERALQLFREAAQMGHAEACYKLGDMTGNGMVCEKDEHRAYELYLMARTFGEFEGAEVAASTAYRLAECYDRGRGCAADAEKALQYYQMAAHEYCEAIEDGFGYCVRNRDDCREALKRLARAYVDSWMMYYLELEFNGGMRPFSSVTIIVKQAHDNGANIIFRRSGENGRVIKYMNLEEYTDFACEVYALGVYYWAPKFYTQYEVLDGITWELNISWKGDPINCKGTLEYPPELPELFELFESYGIPNVWEDPMWIGKESMQGCALVSIGVPFKSVTND